MRAKLETAARNPENQDRGAVIEASVGLIMVVADGASGQSGDAEAAAINQGVIAWELKTARYHGVFADRLNARLTD